MGHKAGSQGFVPWLVLNAFPIVPRLGTMVGYSGGVLRLSLKVWFQGVVQKVCPKSEFQGWVTKFGPKTESNHWDPR